MFVFGWSADRMEGISLWANRLTLGMPIGSQVFDLSSRTADLELLVHVYEKPVRSWPFCTDLSIRTTTEKWRAVRGTVTIELSPPGVDSREPQLYRALIQITRAEFVNDAGVRKQQVEPITLTAIVGRMFGYRVF